MRRNAIGLLAGLAASAALLTLAPLPTQAATWVPLQGNVRTGNGTPVCALVLANGQYMFSCGGSGGFSLNVPLDEQGQVTLFAFADGFAPYSVTAAPASLPAVVQTKTADPDSPLIAVTRDMECAANNWVRLSGEIESEAGDPLCALVLANGQHMFSCDASQGRYDLTVPADADGNITLFGFADGFQPYSETFVAPECDVRTATADGVQFEYYIAEELVANISPMCSLFVTATNTTAEKKTCFLSISAYDAAGRFVAETLLSGASLNLPPGITDSRSSPLWHSSYSRLVQCEEVATWELKDSNITLPNNPGCVAGTF